MRDLRRLWAQALAVALVMGAGVATIILAVGAYRSLDETRATFYERYRFGSVFASVVRAPLHLKSRIEAISGVSAVELRIKESILLDIEGMKEPASGIAISLPDIGEPAVNRLYLRKGRFPETGRENEVVIVETFAEAHGFQPGDHFEAILNGRKTALKIVGIVLSPEFIYLLGPGNMVPDQKHYGVIYMSETALQGLFNMDAAFSSVALSVLRNADRRAIIEELDEILKPYGGAGAFERKDQRSNAFLDAELTQLKAMASIIPPIFLLVSAFLVNMILSRLIALEREQVGLLKALGYSNFAIGGHYAKLVVAISIIGLIIGSGFGFWLGRGLTRLYAEFFSFPFLIFRQSIDLYLLAGGVTVFAALAGAAKSIWSIVILPPAVAMRPPTPVKYRSFFLHKLHQFQIFSQLSIMALRNILRRPIRALLTTLGTALSVAILITALFTFDSINYMIDIVFFQSGRHDASLSFTKDESVDILSDVAVLPGVMKTEPFRATPVIMRNGPVELRMSISGLPKGADLVRILDVDLNPVSASASGLFLTERVAEKLSLRPGDVVEVELTEKNDRIAMVQVVGVVQSYVGLNAYMSLDGLNRLMRDGQLISGARIIIDEAKLPELYQSVKNTPAISSITLQNIVRKLFRDTIEKNITTMTVVYITLAVIITFGVIYNTARIQLSERARELASLRVFGFTKAEVSSVLFIELFTMILLAQPVGWLLGYFFAWNVARGFENDLFRIPLIINVDSYGSASLIVLIASLVSALIVRRRVDQLDLIKVLKTRE